VGIAIFSIVLLAVAVEVASRGLRRVWQQEPPSARREWLQQRLFTPIIWVPFFHSWMRRKLERNPIGWLEQRTWSGRLVTWSWFAIVVSLYSAALGNPSFERAMQAAQFFISWLLLGSMAASAAGSFHRERESGMMELLLVSPMSVGQIIGGRLRGLWGQFLPAFMLLLFVWIYFAGYITSAHQLLRSVQFLFGAFLAIPVIGLFYSLRRRNFLSAFFMTVLMGLVLPSGLQFVLRLAGRLFLFQYLDDMSLIGSGVVYYSRTYSQELPGLLGLLYSPSFITLIQLALALRFGWRLYLDMERRNFVFSRNLN
jgi:ABC-type transport system involved in multi-copper enzyme maturation permease subunit